MVLSLEMFESDVQQVLDEYVLHKAIREEDLLQDSRPWANYKRDYQPLVQFCREHGVRVVAANAPRRYVSLVARSGGKALETLLKREQASGMGPASQELPPMPLPPASAAYRQKFVDTIASQMASSAPHGGGSADNGGGSGECPFIGFRASDVREVKPEMMEAQLLWDHSMAQSIARALQEEEEADESGGPGPLVLHVCGAFHCAHGLGIPEALPRYARGARRHPNSEASPRWLPMDDALATSGASGGDDREGDRDASDHVGPKRSPPGVVSIVCWPAAVGATLEAVRSGRSLPSLGAMGDWVVITEESWGDGSGSC
jgi:hypothetical protein